MVCVSNIGPRGTKDTRDNGINDHEQAPGAVNRLGRLSHR